MRLLQLCTVEHKWQKLDGYHFYIANIFYFT